MQIQRRALPALTVAALAAVSGAGPASAQSADFTYNIAIHEAIPSTHCVVALHLSLQPDFTGSYEGTACGSHASGTVTWVPTKRAEVIVNGIVLSGLGDYATVVRVPAYTGTFTGDDCAFLTLPSDIPCADGTSTVHVAP